METKLDCILRRRFLIIFNLFKTTWSSWNIQRYWGHFFLPYKTLTLSSVLYISSCLENLQPEGKELNTWNETEKPEIQSPSKEFSEDMHSLVKAVAISTWHARIQTPILLFFPTTNIGNYNMVGKCITK